MILTRYSSFSAVFSDFTIIPNFQRMVKDTEEGGDNTEDGAKKNKKRTKSAKKKKV